MLRIFIFVFLIIINFHTFAEEENNNNILGQNQECIKNKYDINGNFDIKINTNSNYNIKNNIVGENQEINIIFQLIENGKIIEEIEGKDKINLSFSHSGKFLLKTKIKEIPTQCEYIIEKEISVYSKFIYHISDNEFVNVSFDDDFKKNNIYFYKAFFNNKNSESLQDEFLSKITEKLYNFQEAEIIIINVNNFLEIFQGFEKLSKIYNINFSNKKIFIITDSNLILSKKILSNFINTLNLKVYTLNFGNLLNFLNYLLVGNSSTDAINKKMYGISKISFDYSENNIFFLSKFTNYLISSGFPINVLGIIFSLGLVFTIINFMRQFIGFSIFSIYYPIFIALSIYLFTFDVTLILFFSSLFCLYILQYFIYKKIHFLLNTKISIFFIFYIIISLILMYISSLLGKVDFSIIKSNLIIFPFITIPMSVYKVFYYEKNIFSFAFIFYIGEFLFLIMISYFIIQSSFIQNIFLAYSELLVLLLILNFFIGKFSGLQIFEYARFFPLIRKKFYNEEE